MGTGGDKQESSMREAWWLGSASKGARAVASTVTVPVVGRLLLCSHACGPSQPGWDLTEEPSLKHRSQQAFISGCPV